MSEITRRKLSIAFTTYNKAVAHARRIGDTKAIEAWKKILGKLVKEAYRSYRQREYRPLSLLCEAG